MVINTNIAATRTRRLLEESSNRLSASVGRMSSGSRIVSPQDDAGGLAQTINLDNQVTRLNAAISNNTNFRSMLQTQDGYAQKVQSALIRLNELAILYGDTTKTENDKALYELEFNQIEENILDITSKSYNGIDLFFTEGKVFKDSNANATILTTNNIADGLGGGEKTTGGDGEYKIDLVFEPNAEGLEFTPEHKALLEKAANRIEGFITGDLTDWLVDGELIDDLKITAKIMDASDTSGALAYAEVSGSIHRTTTSPTLAVTGRMQFNESYLDTFSAGMFYGVALHEMIHLLGFHHSKFIEAGLIGGYYNDGSAYYNGTNAVTKFNEVTGANLTPYPANQITLKLEDDGGGGTVNHHWEETEYLGPNGVTGGVYGFGNEIMTGWAESVGVATPISKVTIGALDDIGYEVNYDTADPWTGPGTGTGPSAAMRIDSLASVRIAVKNLANSRAQIGAQLAYTTSVNESLSIEKENLMAASSRIKDVDFAKESTSLARQSILVNMGTAMLAQANVLPELLLRLIE